jgi:hypothetical protein
MATATPDTNSKNIVRGRVVAVDRFGTEREARPQGHGFTGNLVAVLYDVDLKDELRGGEGAEEKLAEALREFPGPVSDSLGLVGDRLGSVRLASDGSFEISYEDVDFRIRNPGEKRPDLFLLLQAPERNGAVMKELIIFRTQELRRNAARLEEYFIQIPEEALKGLYLDASGPSEKISSGESERETIDRAHERARTIAKPGQQQMEGRKTKAAAIKETLLANVGSPQVAIAGTGRIKTLSSYAGELDIAEVTDAHYPKQIESINDEIGEANAPPEDETQTGRGTVS